MNILKAMTHPLSDQHITWALMTFISACVLQLRPEVSHGAELKYELRSPLGIAFTQPTRLNEGLSDEAQAKEVLSFGADALVGFDTWYAGLRFDSLSSIKSGPSDETLEIAARIFSLMIQKRWTFEEAHLAPTLNLGLYQSSIVNYRPPAGTFTQYKSHQTRFLSIGIEGSWIHDIYLLGAELGYQILSLEDLRSDTDSRLLNSNGDERVADLNSPYLKFILGLHF